MTEKINHEPLSGYSINAARQFMGQQVKVCFKSGDILTGVLSSVQEKSPYMNLNATTISLSDELGTKEYLLEKIAEIQSTEAN